MEEELAKDVVPVHTEQIQEIIGTPPRWLYRWGITIVLAIAGLCVLISSVISYPETTRTRLIMRSAHAPDAVTVTDSVILMKIIAANGSQVKKDSKLAVLRNAAGEIVVKAPVAGRLTYGGIIHENERLKRDQTLFLIYTDNNDFYAELIIPASEIDKVRPGQTVLVKLNKWGENQPVLRGTIRYVLNDRSVNGDYLAEAEFDNTKNSQHGGNSLWRDGMTTEADINIADATVFKRLIRSLNKIK